MHHHVRTLHTVSSFGGQADRGDWQRQSKEGFVRITKRLKLRLVPR